MPSIPFYMAGQIGIVKDIAAHELPPQAWSDGLNVKFHEGKVVRRDGQAQIYSGQLGQPYWAAPAYTASNAYWVYADLNNLYATDGSAHALVTRVSGAYGALVRSRLWNGGMFQGIPVFTNGVDAPQAWTSIGLSNRFVDLPNWPGTHVAQIIRPFKNFLVAMVITRTGVTYPHMILWSHPADPGSVPSSWDIADPTKLAGERDLVDELPGGIKDALAMRDIMVVYKDNSVWGMQYIGGTQIFRTYQILSGVGILGSGCVAAIKEGRQHVFASADDLIVFDGQNTDAVLDKRWKTYLGEHIDTGVADRSFVFALERTNEAWFCYPELGNEFPNMALIWNWKENTITQKQLPKLLSSVGLGPVVISGDPWDLDSGTWDSDATTWDLAQFRASNFEILGTHPGADLTASRLLQIGSTQQNEGAEFEAFVQRTDIALIGQDRVSGDFKADFEMRKLAKRIWIRAEGSPFQVKLGKQEVLGGGVTWAAPQTFTPGVDRYKDFLVNGRLIAVDMRSAIAGAWSLEGFDLEIEPLGGL